MWARLNEKDKLNKLSDSFNKKVVKKNGCWDWNGYVLKTNYSLIRYGNTKIQSHRASWMIHVGEIPENLCVLHKCDNRRCTNPDHLFLGTRKENSTDMVNKGRSLKGIKHNRNKLSEDDVRSVRKLINYGVNDSIISKFFSVTPASIWFIKNGVTWKHLN